MDLVFCDERGDYLKPDNKSAKGCYIARRCKLGVAITVGRKNAKVGLVSAPVRMEPFCAFLPIASLARKLLKVWR